MQTPQGSQDEGSNPACAGCGLHAFAIAVPIRPGVLLQARLLVRL